MYMFLKSKRWAQTRLAEPGVEVLSQAQLGEEVGLLARCLQGCFGGLRSRGLMDIGLFSYTNPLVM